MKNKSREQTWFNLNHFSEEQMPPFGTGTELCRVYPYNVYTHARRILLPGLATPSLYSSAEPLRVSVYGVPSSATVVPVPERRMRRAGRTRDANKAVELERARVARPWRSGGGWTCRRWRWPARSAVRPTRTRPSRGGRTRPWAATTRGTAAAVTPVNFSTCEIW